jgi:chromosomal replication initiation ATPase DnaA
MLDLSKSLIQDATVLFEIVTDVTGITQDQINKGSRKRNITDARMMMCEALRRNSLHTLTEIGSVVGGLDHSSIIYYRSKLDDICDVDKEFKRKFTEINSRFKEIKVCGLPLATRLRLAIDERDKLSKEIRRMKRKLNI